MPMTSTSPPESWLEGKARRIPLERLSDERGSLLPLDFHALPFAPQRIFVVHEVPVGAVRGRHAHHRSRQLLVRLQGRIEVEMRCLGATARTVLEDSHSGLLLEAGVWAAQTYLEPGSSLLVLASEVFHPSSYIADTGE